MMRGVPQLQRSFFQEAMTFEARQYDPTTGRNYPQDKNIINGKPQDKLKARIKIAVPEGMTQQEFDDRVVQTAKSFGNNPGITYFLCPVKETQGNCNTSTSTILLKSGVSKDAIFY